MQRILCSALTIVVTLLLTGCLKTNEHDAAIQTDKSRTQVELGRATAATQTTIAGYRHTEEMARIEAGREASRAAVAAAQEQARIDDGTKRYTAELFYASSRFVLGMVAVLGTIGGIAMLAFNYLANKGGAQLEHETRRLAFDALCKVLPTLPEGSQLAAINGISRGLGNPAPTLGDLT